MYRRKGKIRRRRHKQKSKERKAEERKAKERKKRQEKRKRNIIILRRQMREMEDEKQDMEQ